MESPFQRDMYNSFLKTLYKTKSPKKAIQLLFNAGIPEETFHEVIQRSSEIVPGLKGVRVDFSKLRKTKEQLHISKLTEQNLEDLKTDEQVKANTGAYRKLMGLGDIVEGLVSTFSGGGDNDEVAELPTPVAAQQPPAKKQKTRPVPGFGEEAVQGLKEVSGVAAVGRLAKKAGDAAFGQKEILRPIRATPAEELKTTMADFRENINEQAKMKEPRVQRGKDEIESQPMGPSDGTPIEVDSPVDPPAPQGYDGGSPYAPSTGLVDITFDASFNPEFVANYETVKTAFNQKGAEQRAIALMRTFHNKYFKGKKKFRSDDVNPTTMMDAFNGIVKEENAKFPRKTDEPKRADDSSEPGILARVGSAAMDAGSAAAGALGITDGANAVGNALMGGLRAVTPPKILEVLDANEQRRSESNVPIPHDPLTTFKDITVAGGKTIVDGYVDTGNAAMDIATQVLNRIINDVTSRYVDKNDQDGGLLAEAAILNPRDEFKFGWLPPRMGSAPALAEPNGLKNAMIFQDAPLTSRISPLVEEILIPPSTRPIPASQPEGGRLAMQAFLNYQQDVEAPYAVRR